MLRGLSKELLGPSKAARTACVAIASRSPAECGSPADALGSFHASVCCWARFGIRLLVIVPHHVRRTEDGRQGEHPNNQTTKQPCSGHLGFASTPRQ